jgi:hypothetical protein
LADFFLTPFAYSQGLLVQKLLVQKLMVQKNIAFACITRYLHEEPFRMASDNLLGATPLFFNAPSHTPFPPPRMLHFNLLLQITVKGKLEKNPAAKVRLHELSEAL